MPGFCDGGSDKMVVGVGGLGGVGDIMVLFIGHDS